MGVTDRKRPQFLAVKLANEAMAGDLVQTSQSGDNPTWNQPLVNTVQYSNAHYIQSYAFSNGANRSLIVFNLHRTSSLLVNFAGVNAPSGSVIFKQLTSANITDTNENAQTVATTSQTLNNFNPNQPFSLPPYSMTVLQWSVGPDLSVSKTHSGNFTVGANGVYTLTVANIGSAASSGTVTVTDTLPTGLTLVSAAGTGWVCSSSAQTVNCTYAGSIGAGVSTTISLTAAVGARAVPRVTNTVQVSNSSDINPANNGASDVAVVGPNPLDDNLAFVRQQYLDFLNRDPEPAGLNFWTSQLNSGALSRAQVVYEYFRSPEFQDNGGYIARLYTGILFRRAEYDGFLFWLGQLNSGAQTKDQIISLFISSPEFQSRFGGSLTNREFVRRLYLNILFRDPDQAGSDYWTAQLDSGALTRTQMTRAFVESPEYIALTDTSIFVQLEYIGLLRRAADDGGFQFWVSQFNSGRSRLDLINQFILSTEYRSRFQ